MFECAQYSHVCHLPKDAWTRASLMPKYGHCWFGQAKPSVSIRVARSPAAFHLTPGTRWRRSCPSTQRGSGAETTGGAIVWGAWLQQTVERAALGPSSWGGRPKMEPVKTPEPRQREEGTDHEQEHEHMKGHTKPRCLKWGEGRVP
jgi:hypothetical protein